MPLVEFEYVEAEFSRFHGIEERFGELGSAEHDAQGTGAGDGGDSRDSIDERSAESLGARLGDAIDHPDRENGRGRLAKRFHEYGRSLFIVG